MIVFVTPTSQVSSHQLEVIFGAIANNRSPRAELDARHMSVPQVRPFSHQRQMSSHSFISDYGDDPGNTSPDALSPDNGYEQFDFQVSHLDSRIG